MATEHKPYLDPPPGFARVVGKKSHNDQHSPGVGPDEVLASNGHRVNPDANAGAPG